jgi:hypothetical protein
VFKSELRKFLIVKVETPSLSQTAFLGVELITDLQVVRELAYLTLEGNLMEIKPFCKILLFRVMKKL